MPLKLAPFYLAGLAERLVILDEVQRMPDLFPVLRGLVDERRRAGEKSCQFLLLGSASPELLRQSSETLAGRISYLELSPLQRVELSAPIGALEMHWERGGYPESFLASDGASSLQWREDFITSYVERYLPQQGITAMPIVLHRFCSMLAHQQGATINLAKLAASLGIDGKTVTVEIKRHSNETGSLVRWPSPGQQAGTGKRQQAARSPSGSRVSEVGSGGIHRNRERPITYPLRDIAEPVDRHRKAAFSREMLVRQNTDGHRPTLQVFWGVAAIPALASFLNSPTRTLKRAPFGVAQHTGIARIGFLMA